MKCIVSNFQLIILKNPNKKKFCISTEKLSDLQNEKLLLGN